MTMLKCAYPGTIVQTWTLTSYTKGILQPGWKKSILTRDVAHTLLLCNNSRGIVLHKPVKGVLCQHKYNISISNLVLARITVSFGSKDGTSVLKFYIV
jgi:hypothetical protein